MIEILSPQGLGEMPVGGGMGQCLARIQGPKPTICKKRKTFVSLSDVKPSAAAAELAVQTGNDPRLVELVLSRRKFLETQRDTGHPGTILDECGPEVLVPAFPPGIF